MRTFLLSLPSILLSGCSHLSSIMRRSSASFPSFSEDMAITLERISLRILRSYSRSGFHFMISISSGSTLSSLVSSSSRSSSSKSSSSSDCISVRPAISFDVYSSSRLTFSIISIFRLISAMRRSMDSMNERTCDSRRLRNMARMSLIVVRSRPTSLNVSLKRSGYLSRASSLT